MAHATRPFVDRLGLAMINMHTKFEVSMFTHYNDIKGNTQYVEMGWIGSQGSPKVTSNVTVRQKAYRTTSYSTLTKLCIYLVPFSSYSELFVKSCGFQSTPPAFGTPTGVTTFEFRQDLWHQKTGVHGISCVIVCVILCLAVLVEH